MLVHAVARVDDARFDRPRKQIWRPAHGVADNDEIVLHRIQRLARIDERLSLCDGRRTRRDIDGRRAHVFCRQLKAGARPRAVLVKENGGGTAFEMRQFLDSLPQKPLHVRGGVEYFANLFRARVHKAEQIFSFNHSRPPFRRRFYPPPRPVR
jgi:hypothetical protein